MAVDAKGKPVPGTAQQGRVVAPPTLRRPGAHVVPRICIFGKGGVGKTSQLGFMPGRGVVLETPIAEGYGDFVLSNHAERIAVYDIEEWGDYDPIYDWLKSGNHDRQWIGMDSITGAVQLAKTRALHDDRRPIDADPHNLTMQDWGLVGGLVTDLIYKFARLPYPIIWTAQQKVIKIKDDRGQEDQLLGPNVTPMALDALLPNMMLTAHLFKAPTLEGTLERRMRIADHPYFLTKARAYPGVVVPNVIRNPDIGVVVRFLLGKEEKLDVVREDDDLVAFDEDDD